MGTMHRLSGTLSIPEEAEREEQEADGVKEDAVGAASRTTSPSPRGSRERHRASGIRSPVTASRSNSIYAAANLSLVGRSDAGLSMETDMIIEEGDEDGFEDEDEEG